MLDNLLLNSHDINPDLTNKPLTIFRDGVVEFFTGMSSPVNPSFTNSPIGSVFSNLDNLSNIPSNNYNNEPFNLNNISKIADSWSNKFMGDTSSLVNPNSTQKTIDINLNNINSNYDTDFYAVLSNSWSNKFIGDTSNILKSNTPPPKNDFDYLKPIITDWSNKFIGDTSNISEIPKPPVYENNLDYMNIPINNWSDKFIDNTSNIQETSRPLPFKINFEPLEPILNNNINIPIGSNPLLNIPKYGLVDTEHIDDLNMKIADSFPKNYFEKPFKPSYDLMAQIDILSPKNKFPDFNKFSNLPEYQSFDPIKKVSEYLDYRNNLTNLKESEFKSGINFDTNTFIHTPNEAIKVTDIFKDRIVIDTFAKSKEIEVNNNYLKNIAFFDPIQSKFDDESTKSFKKNIKDAPLVYLPPNLSTPEDSGTLFISTEVKKDLLVGGGLFHEFNHAKLRQDYEPEFRKLESKYDFQKNKKFNGVLNSFEEVATDKMTFDFMNKNPLFTKTIEDKYAEYKPCTEDNLFSKDSLINQISNSLDKEYDHPLVFSRLPESITTLNNVGSPLGLPLFDELKNYDFSNAGKSAMNQHKLFNTILAGEQIDFNPLFNYFDKNKGDKL